jgi:hypothetical protein
LPRQAVIAMEVSGDHHQIGKKLADQEHFDGVQIVSEMEGHYLLS